MKKIASILTLASFVASSSGCITLNLSDSKPGSRPRAAICEKRTAVFVLEDRRTDMNLNRKLSEEPAVAVSRALADKFREHCPDTVKFIDRLPTVIDMKSDSAGTENFDFLLTGTLDRLDSDFGDKYYGLRMAGSIVVGMTFPVGLLLFPVLLVGDVDHITNFDFKISLAEASTGSILWTGASEFSAKERVAFINTSKTLIEKKLNSHMESATSTMFANISSVYKRRQDYGFAMVYDAGKSKEGVTEK